jgi:hypothetical protein
MARIFILFALLLTFMHAANAQAVRQYQQSLPVAATTTALQIVPEGADITVVKYSGTDILVDVTITTTLGTTQILNHLQREGRYDLLVQVEGNTAIIMNKLAKRQTIKTKGVALDEQIKYVISIPENFSTQGTNAFAKLR